MSVISITGRVLRVVGDFLSEPTIADWIESKTADGLRNIAEIIGVELSQDGKDLAEKLKSVSLDSLEMSEPLQVAISTALRGFEQLPELVARKIVEAGVSSLITKSTLVEAVAVPRYYLVEIFSYRMLEKFKQNFELNQYHDLLQMILRGAVLKNEQEFYDSLRPRRKFSDKACLAGKDCTYNWGKRCPHGSYYIFLGHPDIALGNSLDDCLKRLKESIGLLNTDAVNNVVNKLLALVEN